MSGEAWRSHLRDSDYHDTSWRYRTPGADWAIGIAIGLGVMFLIFIFASIAVISEMSSKTIAPNANPPSCMEPE